MSASREPVPFEVYEPGVYLHGTKAALARGDLLAPGRESNFEAGRVMNYIYFTATLDAAVWGHISDGNVHPNVIPRSLADVESGKEAILAFGREVIRMGGSPLAEHGVGRNPIKQELLRMLYGDAGIDAMRAVKRALDSENKLAPGVLFDSQSA